MINKKYFACKDYVYECEPGKENNFANKIN